MAKPNLIAQAALTQQRLRELLYYDPNTGLFWWRITQRKAVAGTVAGVNLPDGYVRINIDNRHYRAHRLAWFYMTNRWPDDQVDHQNRKRNDNRWENLREATDAQQRQNMSKRSNNISGFIGVSWYTRDSRWKATIKVGAKLHHIGCYDDPAEAAAAYAEAKALYHTFNPSVPV